MKSLIFTFYFLSCAFHLSAQINFPGLDAQWCYNGFGDTGEDLGNFCFGPSEIVNVNAKSYSKIEFKPHPYTNSQTAYYREEDRKFYVLPQDSIDEFLVYDFNLEIGDRFTADYSWGLSESITLEVKEVDSLTTLDGIERKRIYLENDAYFGIWVEGIGSLNWVFMLPAYVSSTSGGFDFICHNQKSDLIYTSGSEADCDFIDSTDEIEREIDFSIFPNPIEDQIQISLAGLTANSFIIYNSYGKSIMEKEISQGTTTYQFSEIESGIYFIQLQNQKGQISTKKFIKY